MNTKQLISKRTIGLVLAAVLTVFIMAPTSVLAVTAAGTVISNTATVTWTGDAVGKTATVTVTVLTKEAAPTIDYVSTDIAAAVNNAIGVAENTSVTVTYSAKSNANGVDIYDLDWSATEDLTNIANPTYDAGNPATVTLGGSILLSEVSGTYTITGLLADHGLEDKDTVLVGADATPYTITILGEVGGNTTFTLDGTPTVVTTGTPIYEYKEFDLTLTTGTLANAAAANHAMTLMGSPDGDGTLTGSVLNPTIYVKPADITISKTANPTSGKPGDTITYVIVVTNGGSAETAGIVITDPIPNFTDYNGNLVNGACTTSFSSTATPATFTYTPSATLPDADVAAVKFDCGALAGGSTTVTVGFDVIIE